ncbi:uncharacterized protein LOC130614647 [Hydractinia symbiolongicarpus]|uniref:uncharacterized protein LOC130614647 n=1 Tax=Hydractinia symbiolongicarpus TaxID=13093 RepID=UPI00254DF1DC|nr:uncharacterized protein LOC130614647 [Hydractinia symbiolongicarpus]
MAERKECSCKEEIAELLRVNLCWKRDYEELMRENTGLKKNFFTPEKIKSGSVDNFELFKQQLQECKKKNGREREKNQQLISKCTELEVRLDHISKELEIARSQLQQSKSYRTSSTKVKMSARDVVKAQSQATQLHSVPGLHIPGSFVATGVERDNLRRIGDATQCIQQVCYKRSNSF